MPKTPTPRCLPLTGPFGRRLQPLWSKLPPAEQLALVELAEHAVVLTHDPAVVDAAFKGSRHPLKNRKWPHTPIWPFEQRLRRLWVFLTDPMRHDILSKALISLGEPAPLWEDIQWGQKLAEHLGDRLDFNRTRLNLKRSK